MTQIEESKDKSRNSGNPASTLCETRIEQRLNFIRQDIANKRRNHTHGKIVGLMRLRML